MDRAESYCEISLLPVGAQRHQQCQACNCKVTHSFQSVLSKASLKISDKATLQRRLTPLPSPAGRSSVRSLEDEKHSPKNPSNFKPGVSAFVSDSPVLFAHTDALRHKSRCMRSFHPASSTENEY